MVLNAAVQMLREADELKQKILKFKSGTSMLQERSLWVTQQQLQKVYQKVLVLDLDYALEKKVEQDLWNVGFKQQIEALQAISKDRKKQYIFLDFCKWCTMSGPIMGHLLCHDSPLRSEGQAMLSWVLQAAAGFYLCLLHQICTTFKLDLPFRRRASLLGWVEGWGAGEATGGSRLPPPAAARYICQHCLVHLGDLARYRQQLRVAHTFYRHALVVSAHSGQPYNQLALVAWRRGRRLAALYWHVRSLLVRAPFPPAPANLARTLHAAASGGLSSLPVLPGMEPQGASPADDSGGRLHAQAYVTSLVRALHLIHSVDQLDTAETIVNSLNSSLTALIATDSFESMMLIKMTCVLIWLVHSSNEDYKLESNALSEGEAKAAQLSETLASSAILALLLPAYTLDAPPERALPALKVWLQWCVCHPRFLQSASWSARPALWPALAHALARLAALPPRRPPALYDTVPLPEDEELHGFLPLEEALKPLRFANHAAWDSYGGRVPDVPDDATDDEPPCDVSTTCLSNDPELEKRVRAYRLLQLGRSLAGLCPSHLQCSEEDDLLHFTATSVGGEQLSAALAELSVAAAQGGGGGGGGGGGEGPADVEGETDSDDEPDRPPPPIVISEADFREKVREKRVGILKPQGSLERAREERAMASTQDDPLQESDGAEDISKFEDKKDSRKPRVNIAMAAIMRKQEETNKQVKFVTPPPTPESTGASNETKDQDKPKVIQPKAIKNLASLPLGRKTGGILSLKDKSAGYPHLQNTDPEPPKKTDKEDKKEPKSNQGSSQNSQQSYQPKRQDVPQPNWSPSVPPPNTYNDGPRMNFQKNYGIQNAGITYNPNYPSPPNVSSQGIRLPVVNPKEIDVRTAALQKQNSRQELFQDGHKFGNYNYQMSGDKKNFLNDLPPRFANQYRYWQTAQENQFNDNKFRDDSFKPNSLFNTQPPTWGNTSQQQEDYTQSMPWWKPENLPPSFSNPPNFSPSMMQQPNFYSPHIAPNVSNPYQNMSSFNQMQNQSVGQQKTEGMLSAQNYIPSSIGQPQLQNLQNIVSSPNFNSSLNNFGTFTPTVGYDSAMYPQFNNNKIGYQQVPMKMMDKPAMPGYQANKDLMDIGGLGFGSNAMDMQQKNLGMKFNDPMNSDNGAMKNMDQVASGSGASTYSLFSGADAPPWPPRHAHQSLWSGPGPSPLERLLEQQKQLKQPPAPH